MTAVTSQGAISNRGD